MICDMITAYDHVLSKAGASDLVVRRFEPRIANSVSILTPSYAGRSRLTQAFVGRLSEAIGGMSRQFDDL